MEEQIGVIKENLPSWQKRHPDDPSEKPTESPASQPVEDAVRAYTFKITLTHQECVFTTVCRSGKKALENVEKYFKLPITAMQVKPIKVSKPCRIEDLGITRKELAPNVKTNEKLLALKGSNNDLSTTWRKGQRAEEYEDEAYFIGDSNED